MAIKIAEKGEYKDAYIAYLEEYIRIWSNGQLHTNIDDFTEKVSHEGWNGYFETSDGIYFKS